MNYERAPKGAAVFDEAKQWEGWGTALKPAHEPIAFARKRMSEGSVVKNVIRHGTGAINVDAARVDWLDGADHAAAAAAAARVTRDEPKRARWGADPGNGFQDPHGSLATWESKSALGRWPANVLHDGSVEVFAAVPPRWREMLRFFYAAKAGKEERDFGLKDRPVVAAGGYSGRHDGSLGSTTKRANHHPTVKPVDLMRWLCRLITPPGGIVLDPFCGSGSTGIAAVREGLRFVGVEQSPEYFDIARRRVEAAVNEAEQAPTLTREIDKALAVIRAKQIDLFIPETTG